MSSRLTSHISRAVNGSSEGIAWHPWGLGARCGANVNIPTLPADKGRGPLKTQTTCRPHQRRRPSHHGVAVSLRRLLFVRGGRKNGRLTSMRSSHMLGWHAWLGGRLFPMPSTGPTIVGNPVEMTRLLAGAVVARTTMPISLCFANELASPHQRSWLDLVLRSYSVCQRVSITRHLPGHKYRVRE